MPRFNTIAIVACLQLVLCVQAAAQLSIEDFNLTPNSVSFVVQGTFPETFPRSFLEGFLFVNPDPDASPGFALGSNLRPDNENFTGPQSLRTGYIFPIGTGGAQFGDYFFVAFDEIFLPGDNIDGRVTANWSTTAFDINAVETLNVFWGSDITGQDVEGGVLIDVVLVPEPTTQMLIGAATPLLIRYRRWT